MDSLRVFRYKASMRKPTPILSVIRPKTLTRFKQKLVKSGTCLNFTGARNKRGYGFVDVSYNYSARRYAILAHRLAWALANGRDPDEGLIVCHRCNNPPCCNPKHLYLGTPQDNTNDMIKAGTGRFDAMKGRKGTAHPRATYSQVQRDQVIDMKRETQKTMKEIAAIAGVSYQTACRWWNDFVRDRSR